MFFPTLLLKAIVEYVEQPGNTPVSAAWLWVVLFLVCSCLQSIADSQALWSGRKMSVNLGAIAIGEIYAKALRRKAAAGTNLASDDKGKGKAAPSTSPTEEEASVDGTSEPAKPPADSQAKSGTIINLMSSDSARIGEMTSYIHW